MDPESGQRAVGSAVSAPRPPQLKKPVASDCALVTDVCKWLLRSSACAGQLLRQRGARKPIRHREKWSTFMSKRPVALIRSRRACMIPPTTKTQAHQAPAPGAQSGGIPIEKHRLIGRITTVQLPRGTVNPRQIQSSRPRKQMIAFRSTLVADAGSWRTKTYTPWRASAHVITKIAGAWTPAAQNREPA
jgi:hypothetical protein